MDLSIRGCSAVVILKVQAHEWFVPSLINVCSDYFARRLVPSLVNVYSDYFARRGIMVIMVGAFENSLHSCRIVQILIIFWSCGLAHRLRNCLGMQNAVGTM